MSGYPIRIAIRVDFSDGSEHEYEVRGQDAVATKDLPPGPLHGFWPEGVVTADVAERMKHDAKREAALADAEFRLKTLREFAVSCKVLPVPGEILGQRVSDRDWRAARAAGREVADAILRILDAP